MLRMGRPRSRGSRGSGHLLPWSRVSPPRPGTSSRAFSPLQPPPDWGPSTPHTLLPSPLPSPGPSSSHVVNRDKGRQCHLLPPEGAPPPPPPPHSPEPRPKRTLKLGAPWPRGAQAERRRRGRGGPGSFAPPAWVLVWLPPHHPVLAHPASVSPSPSLGAPLAGWGPPWGRAAGSGDW